MERAVACATERDDDATGKVKGLRTQRPSAVFARQRRKRPEVCRIFAVRTNGAAFALL